jgi:predicted transposase YbfD/YdcC
MLLEAGIYFDENRLTVLRAGTHDRHGGRDETRRLRVGAQLARCRDWTTPVRFVEVRSTVREKRETRRETRYFLTNLPPDQATPQRLLRLVRGHWGIENRLHYVRDVTFDEDRCPIRTGNGPRVAATARSLVIALLRACHFDNIAAGLRSLAYKPQQALNLVTTPPPRIMK